MPQKTTAMIPNLGAKFSFWHGTSRNQCGVNVRAAITKNIWYFSGTTKFG